MGKMLMHLNAVAHLPLRGGGGTPEGVLGEVS